MSLVAYTHWVLVAQGCLTVKLSNSRYVYHLIDPRNGKVFWVGKGQFSRAWVSSKETFGRNGKAARLRELAAVDMEAIVKIVAQYRTDDEAFAAEAREIARIGIENLTNRSR